MDFKMQFIPLIAKVNFQQDSFSVTQSFRNHWSRNTSCFYFKKNHIFL